MVYKIFRTSGIVGYFWDCSVASATIVDLDSFRLVFFPYEREVCVGN